MDDDLLTLRELRDTDIAQVAAIDLILDPYAWSANQYHEALCAGYVSTVIARGEDVLACLVTMPTLDTQDVLRLLVSRPWQRRGLARRLMSHAIAQAQASAYSCLYLEVRASNHAAQSLYTSLGFTIQGQRRNYYRAPHGREDAVVMALPLRTSTTVMPD